MPQKKKSDFSVLRETTGLSLEEVAEKTGYKLRTIYRWENGETEPRRAAMELLERERDSRLAKVSRIHRPTFTFIDLFAGIGGMRIAFEAAGGRCVFTSEWDAWAQKTYSANFALKEPIAGDITKIQADDIPDHDVLVGGFPCQPFSIAGVSKKNSLGRKHGFLCEAQGTLFFDVARIIAHRRPKAFLLENVKNLVSHDGRRTFKVIYNTLVNELGYNVTWRIIDAKSFVPQHRERIFIVGFREDVGYDINSITLPDPASGPRMGSILHPEDGTEEVEEPYTVGAKARVSPKYSLSDKLWAYLQNYAVKHQAKGNGFGYGLVGCNDIARTLSARYYKDGSEILIKQKRKNPRRLTPRECARLMGFDQPGREPFKLVVSDTRAYKQFGNAVVVPVVECIAASMEPFITGHAAPMINSQLSLPLGDLKKVVNG